MEICNYWFSVIEEWVWGEIIFVVIFLFSYLMIYLFIKVLWVLGIVLVIDENKMDKFLFLEKFGFVGGGRGNKLIVIN